MCRIGGGRPKIIYGIYGCKAGNTPGRGGNKPCGEMCVSVRVPGRQHGGISPTRRWAEQHWGLETLPPLVNLPRPSRKSSEVGVGEVNRARGGTQGLALQPNSYPFCMIRGRLSYLQKKLFRCVMLESPANAQHFSAVMNLFPYDVDVLGCERRRWSRLFSPRVCVFGRSSHRCPLDSLVLGIRASMPSDPKTKASEGQRERGSQ